MWMSGTVLAMAMAMLVACGIALADEDADFGVAATRDLRLADYGTPTPREVPGARTLRTAQLKSWIQRDARTRPVLLDVLGGEAHDSLPGAVWLPGAGRGTGFSDAVQAQLARALEELGVRASGRALVFFCASVSCWLSYNAALRAVALGYTEVYWYRGGIDAWVDAGGELSPARMTWRPDT
jgi:PQQ-dependent catabolism-associated CXXCW motif protein